MKTKLLLLFAILLPLATRAADDLTSALQKGLFEEEANQNLPAAIKAYESLLAVSDDQRKLAATALFRLGECYRKLGKTNDAVAQYQRLLRDYADQTTLATLSRQNLAGLGLVPSTAGNRMAPASGGNEAQRLLIERLELEIKTAEGEVVRLDGLTKAGLAPTDSADKARARLLDLRRQLLMAQDSGAPAAADSGEAAQAEALLKQLRDLSYSQLRRVLPTVAPDTLLNTLLEEHANTERRLASARPTFGDDHPSAKSTREGLKVLEGQIEGRIEGILKGLEIKASALKERTTTTTGSGGGSRAGAVAPLNEEEQEVRRIQALIKDSPDLINAVNVEVTKIRRGENLDSYNGTLLHKAASVGQLLVAKYLLEHGASVSLRDQVGKQPLHWAAANGHKAMVELLLANRAEVNAVVSDFWIDKGASPLLLAVEKGYRTVCEFLLERGADPGLGEDSGTPPIVRAVWRDDEAMLRLLLAKGAKANPEPGKKGFTPLHNAKTTNIARILIEAGATVDALNSDNQSPLHASASVGNRGLVEVLLAAGANPNLKDKDGKTPLHLASASWRAGVVAPLIAKGANPNERNTYGGVPLDEVIRFEDSRGRDSSRTPQFETLQAFLAGGADPNLTSAGNGPHLFRAVYEGLEDQAEALLKAGANPNATYDSLRKGQTVLIRALEGTKRPNSNSPGQRPRSMSLVNLLVEHKADVNLADGNGDSPIFFAMNGGSKDFAEKVPFVEALLMRGANIEARNSAGETPLTVAVTYFAKDLVELLLKHKADPNAKKSNGESPLHLATYRNPECVDILLAAGADPNALDGEGRSALDYVKQSGSVPQPPRVFGQPIPGRNVPSIPGQESSQPKETSRSEIAERLRKAGARDWAPRPGLITVTRRGTGASQVIFTKGTNDWNRHSLLELLTFTFFGDGTHFPFPDFSRVLITRRDPTSGAVKEFTVDLTARLAADGCKADEWLEWGDLVEIPEGVHRLGENWKGLSGPVADSFEQCFPRTLTLKAGGASKELELKATNNWQFSQPNGVNRYQRRYPPRLRSVVRNSGLLLTSSDLSRTKVTRHDATNGRREWTFDLTQSIPEEQDLWLLDGDIIEVPEKP